MKLVALLSTLILEVMFLLRERDLERAEERNESEKTGKMINEEARESRAS